MGKLAGFDFAAGIGAVRLQEGGFGLDVDDFVDGAIAFLPCGADGGIDEDVNAGFDGFAKALQFDFDAVVLPGVRLGKE